MCYACVRVCPVKAIIVKPNKKYPEILSSRCIGCGSCMAVCSPDAIVYRNSKNEAKKLLQSDQTVAAICDPTISAEFDDITDARKFVEMIKALGFDHVFESSFGVDLVADKYRQLFEDFKGKNYISANCPVVVSYVEKFHPEILDNLAPIIPPMVAMAKVIHRKYGENLKTIYLGPCIAAKDEINRHEEDGQIDLALTFKELRELFNEYDIHEKNLEFSDFDEPLGEKGTLYPLSNGIIQAAGIDEDLLEGKVITTEGKHNMTEAVHEFESDIESIRQHFNIFYDEGCMMGPGNTHQGQKFLRRSWVIEYAKRRMKKIDRKKWEDHHYQFADIDFSRTFKNDDQRLPYPSEERIKEILNQIGRKRKSDEVSCGACGYESCRDFAIAVAKGLAKTDMCVTYTLNNRQEYIKTLKATNEKLSKTQKALEESEKKARKEKESAKDSSEIMHLMLQKLRAGVVIMDKNLKIIQSNKRFVGILGEDAESINEVIPGLVGADIKSLLPYSVYNLFTYVLQNNENVISRDIHLDDKFLNISVFTIRKNKIIGAIIRDMFLPEVQKEEVIRRVTDVIDKNLEMVQKIGFLLGEGASETEQMLNSIIEFHKSGKKNTPDE